MASSVSATANYSVCTTWGVLGERYYLLHVDRIQCEFPELTRRALELEKRHKPDLVVVEVTGIGEAFYQALHAQLGDRVQWIRPKQDKQCRAEAVTPILEDGRVFVPSSAQWLDDFRREVTAFPSGKYDDQVDSMVQFLGKVHRLIEVAYRHGPRHAGGCDLTRVPTLNVKITPIGGPLIY